MLLRLKDLSQQDLVHYLYITLDPPTATMTQVHVIYIIYGHVIELRGAMASGGQTPLNAIVIGGTGATGKCLVGYLLKAKVCNS